MAVGLAFVWLAASPVGRPCLYRYFPAMEMQDKGIPEKSTDTYRVINVRSSLNVRARPTTSSEAIGKLEKDATVEVVEVKDGFARIRFNNGEGYVNASYLEKVENKKDTETQQPADKTE